MNGTPSNLLVAVADRVAFIKVLGRANVASSVQFKTLVNNLENADFKNLVLDLSECSTMDSTFLGVVVGLVLHPPENPPGSRAICLQILNANQRVADLLDNLGVTHLFTMIHGANPAEGALEPPASSGGSATQEEISRTCMEAHQFLMAVNPENIPKFKDVVQFLAEDLKHLKP